jgi:ABC-type glycerol-3-phosphate transport system substrate-binding protein
LLKMLGVGAGGAILAACAPTPTQVAPTAAAAVPTEAPAPAATATTAPTTAPAAPEAAKTLAMLSHSSPQTESYRRTADIFKQQTGVSVDITECPFNELQPKMMTELLAGTGKFDVLPITNAMLYPAGDYLEDVTDLYTPELKADLPPSGIEHSRDLKGVLKGMPTLSSLPANFYRTDLLDAKGLKPPTTWEEFVNVTQATTIEATGDQPKIWGALIEASAKAVQPAVKLVGWFYQAGGAIQDANGKPTFNLDPNVEALQFIVDLIHKYKVAPPESSEMIYEDVHNMFMQGRGATAINWQYMVGLANTSDQSVVKGKFAVAPVPAHKTNGVNIDHWVMVIPKDSKNKDIVRQYINLVMTVERQQDLLVSEGLVARFSAMDPADPKVKEINPFIDAWVEEMKWATPQPKWEKLNDAWARLSVAMNNATTLTMTPKEALDQAQKEIAALVG